MRYWEMLFTLENGRCFPPVLVVVNVVLACVDGSIAAIAFSQLIRIHLRTQQLGWTREKVFHLMIGSANLAFPSILFLAAFLLLLSFWVDLCHQANDEDEEDEDNSCRDALLERSKNEPGPSNMDGHRKCCPFPSIHIGSRQKFVIVVIVLVFVLMITFAVLIWIGMGKNPIDSSTLARVYIDIFSIAILLLGGALACYGLLLFLKMSRVRSEKASSEMWKVAGLAVVSVVCFTSSALVSLVTDIPVLYHWCQKYIDGVNTSLLVVLYYFIGSSVPSAFVLWVMREMPPPLAVDRQTQSRVVTFISNRSTATHHPQHWTTATSSQNQVTGVSPI
ncbi:PREDICTED: tobamovirus multiplication protein 1 isoform X2 [Nelumbo nucifera]|uniref:Tobamovirus multiplication protein 1 isoform X2 n=1 Tax=Nelumbo nucifera TaxID=4432 RepID=A0A1U7Z3M4_NELNU|nr:PREDICTED: tobamovirus multiplication protein 1 isoform X2 [Nelumbo nucifera]